MFLDVRISSLNQSTARTVLRFMENLLSVRYRTGDFTYVFTISQFPEKSERKPPKMCLKLKIYDLES